MNNIKKIKICIIITVIIVILLITSIVLLKNKPKYNKIDNIIISGDLYDYDKKEAEELKDKISFYTVSKYVSNYLDIINKNNSLYFGTDENGNYVKVIDDDTIKQKVLDILSTDYIEKNKITKNNIYDFIEEIKEKEIFVPLKINILPDRITEKYAVYGFTQDIKYNFIRDCYFIVTLDIQNRTYDIEPILKKQYNDINDIELVNKNINIAPNDNNQYKSVHINNEYVCNKYFDTYKKMLLSKPELAYEYLDKEYREAKYKDFKDFKNKINKEKIKKLTLEKYMVNIKDNYTQYVCMDQNGNYYIFRETSTMDYKLILDTYTIDLPEFVEKYNEATTEEKILINIQKCLEAINNQDYAYMYNKLDETYKKNNFKTLKEFEEYVKENFFEENKFGASNGQKQGDVYTYTITIKDGSKASTEQIKKTFVMKLLEGTDFVMSFEV